MTDPDREVVISGLPPFAEYFITVQAGNPGGLSEPIGTRATTLTAGENYHSYTIQSLIGYRPLNPDPSLHLQLHLPLL